MELRQPPTNLSLASAQAADRLDSWKAIAAHLKRDVRTAQRWEATQRLPVYRHRHGQHDSVYAYKSEIDHWWANRRPPSSSLQKQGSQPHAGVRVQAYLLAHFRFAVYVAAALILVLAAGEARHLFLRYFPWRASITTPATLPIAVPPAAANPEARLDYLTARDFWNRRDPAGIGHAIEYFTKAIREDPKYAPAYAGLSDSYILLSAWDSVSPTSVLSRAKQAAIIAVELSPSLAEAHASLAVVAYRHDWDFSTADREFQEAITLNPSYSRAHEWYGVFLAYMGRFDRAFSELTQAQSLEPLSPIIQSDIAVAYYLNHQNQEAVARFHKILDVNPDFIPALTNLGCILAASGKYDEAKAKLARVAALNGDKRYLEELEPLISAASGNHLRSQKQIKDILKNRGLSEDADVRVAFVYSEMGEKENTLRYLEMAYRNRSWSLVIIKEDPTFDFLRSDPHFQSLERRIGLIPNSSSERLALGN